MGAGRDDTRAQRRDPRWQNESRRTTWRCWRRAREASVRVRTWIERTLEAARPPPRLYGKPLQGDGDLPGPPSPFQLPTAARHSS